MRLQRTTSARVLAHLGALAATSLLATACGGGGGDAAAPEGGNDNEQQTDTRQNWDELTWDQDSWS